MINKKILHTVFEDTVRRFPGKTAIVHGDRTITYEALHDAVRRMAFSLKKSGLTKGSIVGVSLESSIEYIVSITAVMKAGGIFLPIDISLPEKRLEYILRKTPPLMIISGKEINKTSNEIIGKCKKLFIDNELHILDTEGCKPDSSYIDEQYDLPDPDDGNYIMYTSGSTGAPKAILGCHKSLSHFMHWEINEFAFSDNLHVTQLTPVTFDASLRDIYVPLLAGGTLHIPEDHIRTNIDHLIRWMEKSSVNLVHCVPSLFRAITKALEVREHPDKALPALKYILMAGEALYGKDINEWTKVAGRRITLVNLYGASETTLIKTFYRIDSSPGTPGGIIPVGQPISNTTVLIVKGKRLCNIGEIGDIYIKTPFMTKGYYNDPEMTARSFVQNPLSDKSGDIVYKTGDLGRYLPDRSIEFIGRLDTQIKVNGIRIELGEIERSLMAADFIDQAVVIAHKNNEGENSLVCYYTEKRETNGDEIRSFLSGFIPSYMLPAFYLRLDEFPLNINGKIDKKSLPRPDELIYEKIKYAPPENENEEALAAIWGAVLNLEKVGVRSPFFEIGGHSLKATRIISAIYRTFGVDISLKEFFENSTIKALAAVLGTKKREGKKEIPSAEIRSAYDLSHSQKRLWILDRMEEGVSSAYNLPGLYMAEGDFELLLFQRSFLEAIKRHESLRTSFILVDNKPKQKIYEFKALHNDFHIESIDLVGVDNGIEMVKEYAGKEAATPFDLSRPPLLRAKVFRLSADRNIILLTIHHIISDAWSLDVLAGEIFEAYNSLLQGIEYSPTPLKIQYKDYAAWQNSLLNSVEMDNQASYWRKKLSRNIEVLDLPTDYKRPPLRTYRGRSYSFQLDEKLSSELIRLSAKTESTLFMIFLSLIKIVFHKYTGAEDIVVGSPVSGRNHPDLEDQIGFFVNTIVLRDEISGNDTFSSVLKKIEQTTIRAYDNQAYPFDILVNELNLPKDLSRSPLFDVMLVYREEDTTLFPAKGLKITDMTLETKIARFDLTFEITGGSNNIKITINYNSDIFKQDRIKRFGVHLTVLMESVIKERDQRIDEINILSPPEKETVINAFNDTANPSPWKNHTIPDIFKNQVRLTPDNRAVIYGKEHLSYKELDQKATHLASVLVSEFNVSSEDLIGVMTDKSEWSVIALLGVLMSNGAYLPVDPSYPQERIDYILNDSMCSVLLTETKYLDKAGNTSVKHIININDIRSYSPDLSILSNSKRTPRSLAYTIYTSGSTGRPKGVMIEDNGFLNMSMDQIKTFGISETDRVLQFASMSFDASLSEIFMALFSGAAVVIVEKKTIDDPVTFIEYLEEKAVTVATFPPAWLSAMGEQSFNTIKTIITAGEPANIEDALYYSKRGRYFNAYGPTETSVCATIHEVLPDNVYEHSVPIGKPLSNTSIYILNGSMQPLPIGMKGEIFISGPGTARGYLHKPELTEKKFRYNPFKDGERLYSTGDLGRWLPTGEIEFLGRADDQVKIRGYRVELGEIANVLTEHASVEEAVVVTTAAKNPKISAYIVTNDNLDINDIKAHSSFYLPSYMLPDDYIQIDAIPLTAHGKLDKASLPPPDGSDFQTTDQYTPPTNELEKKLVNIWEEVLDSKPIGVHDNFFDLGGDSLQSVRLVSLLSKKLNLPLSAGMLFLHPTVSGLSKAVKDIENRDFFSITVPETNIEFKSDYLTVNRGNLLPLIEKREIPPVDSAALMCLSDNLLDHRASNRDEIIGRWCNNEPLIGSITETSLGRIASIILPCFSSDLYAKQEIIYEYIETALNLASTAGAGKVSLTGHIPYATRLGIEIEEKISSNSNGRPDITNSQATVAAAMLLNLEKILKEESKAPDKEKTGIIGLGSTGRNLILLALQCLPHPEEILLFDLYKDETSHEKLKEDIYNIGNFQGEVRLFRSSSAIPDEFYNATIIIGITNIPDIIDIAKLRPGTVMIEESGRECFSKNSAIERIGSCGDIKFTESDILLSPSPMASILYLPERVEESLKRTGKESLIDYDSNIITGCVISGLLLHRFGKLKPTIGHPDIDACLDNYNVLRQTGFKGAELTSNQYPVNSRQ